MIAANLHLEKKKQKCKEIRGAGRKGRYSRKWFAKKKSELQIID